MLFGKKLFIEFGFFQNCITLYMFSLEKIMHKKFNWLLYLTTRRKVTSSIKCILLQKKPYMRDTFIKLKKSYNFKLFFNCRFAIKNSDGSSIWQIFYVINSSFRSFLWIIEIKKLPALVAAEPFFTCFSWALNVFPFFFFAPSVTSKNSINSNVHSKNFLWPWPITGHLSCCF